MDTVREGPTQPQPTRRFPAEPVAIALALGGLAAAVVLGLLSDGFYQDDGELLRWQPLREKLSLD